jgi:hypothetical protein
MTRHYLRLVPTYQRADAPSNDNAQALHLARPLCTPIPARAWAAMLFVPMTLGFHLFALSMAALTLATNVARGQGNGQREG